jgi:hypothetical protein
LVLTRIGLPQTLNYATGIAVVLLVLGVLVLWKGLAAF